MVVLFQAAASGSDAASFADSTAATCVPAHAAPGRAYDTRPGVWLLALVSGADGLPATSPLCQEGSGLAEILRSDGPWARALEIHQTAADTAERRNQPAAHANALTNLGRVRYLIGHYPAAADALARAEEIHRRIGLRLLKSPPQTARANAICKRVIGTLRRELLDHVLVANEAHLRAVLAEYVAHYNAERPPQGMSQRRPEGDPDNVPAPVTDPWATRRILFSGTARRVIDLDSACIRRDPPSAQCRGRPSQLTERRPPPEAVLMSALPARARSSTPTAVRRTW